VDNQSYNEQQRRIALLLRSGKPGEQSHDLSVLKTIKRGVQPSCPLFSSGVAEYFDEIFPDSFELFMLFYDSQFPFSKVRRGLNENYGLLCELEESGVY
jgi:hypothetical protein